ncbi:hydroxymethylglutaryl-CoA lyase [Flavobacteriaceae bacterium]|nr:hydroxymethylglutaryl-CoA lyase [Flavobacteriaceae bacterium]
MKENIKLIECPRDALQAYYPIVSTQDKIAYYQALLKVGFDTLDCGSFVSPKIIPQMADTEAVIKGLNCADTTTKLLTIIANERGAKNAVSFEKIHYLGYPFSVSENFQVRNTGKTIKESFPILERIVRLAQNHDKEVVVYLSMGFGNPYGDPWSPEIIMQWVEQIAALGVTIFSLSDTVGNAQVKDIEVLFSSLIAQYPDFELGAHFHTHPKFWFEKVNAAFLAGCLRFDGTIKGRGGCPMAQDQLIGNMPTEKLISYLTTYNKLPQSFDVLAFESAYNHSHKIFI